jgi:hypothetical protein
MAKESDTVRFQVPVNEDLAKAIEKLARDIDRPSSWLAVQLIEFSLEDREKFCDWMGLTFLGTAYSTIKKLAGRRSKSLADQAEVRLQLNAPVELVDQITKVAEQWQQTPVKTAATLLASGVHHHEFFLDAIALGKRWAGKSGSTSNVKDNVRHAACLA